MHGLRHDTAQLAEERESVFDISREANLSHLARLRPPENSVPGTAPDDCQLFYINTSNICLNIGFKGIAKLEKEVMVMYARLDVDSGPHH
jgi:hypothetical protein